MSLTVAIVGSGLLGRMLGVQLDRAGYSVSLFDRDQKDGRGSCSYVAAGMLAPTCELDSSEAEIGEMGQRSLRQWPRFLEKLPSKVFFQEQGSLVVAHRLDRGELSLLQGRVRGRIHDESLIRNVSGKELGELEPDLEDRFSEGLFFPREGQVDNRGLLQVLTETILSRGLEWISGVAVDQISPGEISFGGEKRRFDWVVDCRGLGAKTDIPELRGVRGELIRVSAPEVSIRRPVRILHPRYSIYLVPRPENVVVIGATSIESEDLSPISIQSTMELLSAAYAVHPGFAEARVLETIVGCRPSFPDHRPRMYYQQGLMRLNGLYRHGFLIAPWVVEMACHALKQGEPSAEARELGLVF